MPAERPEKLVEIYHVMRRRQSIAPGGQYGVGFCVGGKYLIGSREVVVVVVGTR